VRSVGTGENVFVSCFIIAIRTRIKFLLYIRRFKWVKLP